jgi:predicted MPP superfamily phosphohydrolase
MKNETEEAGAATQDGGIKTDDETRDDGSSGDVICLMGIDDDTLASAQKLQDTLSELQEKIKEREQVQDVQPFTILLAHEPQLFDIYAEYDIDLVLCGHAHGGQFRLPFIGGFVAPDQGFLPTYTEGKHEREGATMIISRGLGNSVIPIRLLNRPELVTITLRSV